MVHFEFKELGSLCTYVKSQYSKHSEAKKQRRSSRISTSNEKPTPSTTTNPPPAKKLHKPPTVQSLHERPRNRLQKRSLTTLLNTPPHQPPELFVLEYEPYPYNTCPSEFLGVYASIDSVTLGAFNHGAYTFSREGLLDGSEYLSPTGRIKIVRQVVRRSGVSASITTAVAGNGGVTRLDIVHPGFQAPRFDSQQDVSRDGNVNANVKGKPKEVVFLAVHEEPKSAFCIGVFTTGSLAWGACLKDKAWLAWSDTLVEEEMETLEGGMPKASARLVGSGRHKWFVQRYEVDSKDR